MYAQRAGRVRGGLALNAALEEHHQVCDVGNWEEGSARGGADGNGGGTLEDDVVQEAFPEEAVGEAMNTDAGRLVVEVACCDDEAGEVEESAHEVEDPGYPVSRQISR